MEALHKLGKAVGFVAYEDEGHGYRKIENKVNALKKRAAFLEKHLQPA